jgi:hypothetical protein
MKATKVTKQNINAVNYSQEVEIEVRERGNREKAKE